MAKGLLRGILNIELRSTSKFNTRYWIFVIFTGPPPSHPHKRTFNTFLHIQFYPALFSKLWP
jgi:hypothetical protein